MGTFWADDEGGKVAIYKQVKRGNLKISKGDVTVSAKLLGHTEREKAVLEMPSFEQFLESESLAVKKAA
jgi:hypothetical protein